MEIAFAVIFGLFLPLYFVSRDKYSEFIKPLDKKDYPLKPFIPAALLLMDIIRYKYRTSYDRKLLMGITEVSGSKYSHYYLRIHWANKILYAFLGLFISVFLGLFTQHDTLYYIFCILVTAFLAYMPDKELNKRIKDRRKSIQMDFPDFLNRLTLLINAGMTVSKAWEKVVTDSKQKGALYEELAVTISDIRAGKSEYKAYEEFAKRCRTPEITRAVAIIIQNLRKGNSELVSVLRVYANECWEMRKNTAKKLGEEASTRMLAPMMLMLVAILIIVAAPAAISLQSF
ncbi:MAG TPA: type II secretion system F family protein [Clostridiaceae bacterium]|nr:type II secretion system F family protein [Clostridiaceae bacterium]